MQLHRGSGWHSMGYGPLSTSVLLTGIPPWSWKSFSRSVTLCAAGWLWLPQQLPAIPPLSAGAGALVLCSLNMSPLILCVLEKAASRSKLVGSRFCPPDKLVIRRFQLLLSVLNAPCDSVPCACVIVQAFWPPGSA